jgi:predicted DNA-binding transcriptional regulator AlpA
MVEQILITDADLPALGITLSKRRLNELIKAGKFPAPIRIGGRQKQWLLSEIKETIAERVASRNNHQYPRVGRRKA